MLKLILGVSLTIGALLGSGLAMAEIESKVLVQGKIGDFDDRKVEMIFETGATIVVPRSTIRAKADQVRPGNEVAAIVHFDDIKLIKKRK